MKKKLKKAIKKRLRKLVRKHGAELALTLVTGFLGGLAAAEHDDDKPRREPPLNSI
jgi:hypothetical protein